MCEVEQKWPQLNTHTETVLVEASSNIVVILWIRMSHNSCMSHSHRYMHTNNTHYTTDCKVSLQVLPYITSRERERGVHLIKEPKALDYTYQGFVLPSQVSFEQ